MGFFLPEWGFFFSKDLLLFLKKKIFSKKKFILVFPQKQFFNQNRH